MDTSGNELEFFFPKDNTMAGGNQNSKDENYKFHFNGILDMETQQETVFNSIAKDVIFQMRIQGNRVLLRWVQWDHIRVWADRVRENLHDYGRGGAIRGQRDYSEDD